MITVLSSDASGQIDGTAMSNFYGHLPKGGDLTAVPVSYVPNYRFNPELENIKTPIVVFDFLEYFNFYNHRTHLLGVGELPVNMKDDSEWQKLNEFFRSRQVHRYFKRELFAHDAPEGILPLEWPCYMDPWPREDQTQFDGRQFPVFNCWGHSNSARPHFHSGVYELMAEGKIDVCSSWDQLDAFNGGWVSLHTPSSHRRHFNEVLLWQSRSKTSVTLPGSGVKCFRSTESPVNTIPVMADDDCKWSIPWINGENCLRVGDATPAHDLHRRLSDDRLHQIYLNAQDTIDQYRTHRYINEYIIPNL
jgi:hypothetical protein